VIGTDLAFYENGDQIDTSKKVRDQAGHLHSFCITAIDVHMKQHHDMHFQLFMLFLSLLGLH